MRIAARVFVALVLLLPLAIPAQAQYFGRNKVQWESFNFKVLRTDHFDIYYYDKEADVVNDIGRMAERWYTRLSTVFHHPLSGRQPLILYATQSQFEQTNVVDGVGEGTGGGLMKNPMPSAPSFWLAYVLVDDIEAATKKAKSLGGTVMKDVTEVMGMGWLSIIVDPTGAMLGLWKAKPRAK